MHLHYSEIDSTNQQAKRLLKARFAAPFSVTCDQQTHGKGQYGRIWYSEPENYKGTFVLKQIKDATHYSFLAAVISQHVVKYYTKQPTLIKWPNDILLNQKKVAGVLIEITDNHVIIGIGINNAIHPNYSQAGVFPAPIDKHKIHAALTQQLQNYLYCNVYKDYKQSLAWQGLSVQLLDSQNHTILAQGLLKSVEKDGGIILKIQRQKQRFYSGSLRLV